MKNTIIGSRLEYKVDKRNFITGIRKFVIMFVLGVLVGVYICHLSCVGVIGPNISENVEK